MPRVEFSQADVFDLANQTGIYKEAKAIAMALIFVGDEIRKVRHVLYGIRKDLPGYRTPPNTDEPPAHGPDPSENLTAHFRHQYEKARAADPDPSDQDCVCGRCDSCKELMGEIGRRLAKEARFL